MKKIFSCALFSVVMLTAWGAAKPQMQVDTVKINSVNNIVSPMKVTVALPETYLAKSDTAHYPVVYLLHGYSDDYSYYPKRMPLDSVASAYNMIIVCPDGRDSWYWDSPVNPDFQMESFFTQELVPTIDSLYRTRKSPEQRAIVGLSMGGHGALWLAMRHSDIWKNAGSMSGGVDITKREFHDQWRMKERLGEFKDNSVRWGEHTVAALVPGLQPGQLNIIFCCGTEDFFFDVNNELSKSLNDHRIGHTYFTAPGDHSWPYWNKVIYPILDNFKSHFDSGK